MWPSSGGRWITIDTSRVAVPARTRLMAGRYPYYLLADSPEACSKKQPLQIPPPRCPAEDIKRALFISVCRTSRLTIANNEEIDAITRNGSHSSMHYEQINTLGQSLAGMGDSAPALRIPERKDQAVPKRA